jgi:hypothetical protein
MEVIYNTFICKHFSVLSHSSCVVKTVICAVCHRDLSSFSSPMFHFNRDNLSLPLSYIVPFHVLFFFNPLYNHLNVQYWKSFRNFGGMDSLHFRVEVSRTGQQHIGL